ncbi:hypothetical protein [Streptomyces sp. R17]|uniref:P-type ATPase A domain-containing protein n=1 Tax=Streptomyces sp. R17 TaxID=3238626 RepID=A0AB39P161_9ACTN
MAAALTIATGDLSDASVILLFITVNTAVGVVQEVRAEQAVMALSAMSAPTARVVRDGEERSVPAAEVVPGDMVLGAARATSCPPTETYCPRPPCWRTSPR